MLSFKTLAIVLMLAGGLVTAYGRYAYHEDPIAVSAGAEDPSADPRHINLPTWVGIATLAVGLSLMLVMRSR